VIQLLDLYGVGEPQRGDLLTLLREAKQRGWMQPYRSDLPAVYSDYIGLEDEARSISNYESLSVPGLLKTEAYARAQLRGIHPDAPDAEVDVRVAARIERQPVLTKEDAPKLWAIMDEAALRRAVGGRRDAGTGRATAGGACASERDDSGGRVRGWLASGDGRVVRDPGFLGRG
jgi:Domain of unknown function (DUF5753)